MLDIGLPLGARSAEIERARGGNLRGKVRRDCARPVVRVSMRAYCAREPLRACSAFTDGVNAMSETGRCMILPPARVCRGVKSPACRRSPAAP